MKYNPNFVHFPWGAILLILHQGCLPACHLYTYVYRSSEARVQVQQGSCTRPGVRRSFPTMCASIEGRSPVVRELEGRK